MFSCMHTCVLFVDDEPLIRSLYETLSPDLGPDFTVKTAKDGFEALRVLDEMKVEIVVSDLEMPEMPGGELLTLVERKYPDAMRVVISGYDDELHVARCLTFGHRYLKKPIEPENLANTLKRLSTLRHTLSNSKVKSVLSGSDSLPSPPETYLHLSEALQKSETGYEDFAAIIEDDPLLKEHLLNSVNSPAFGLSVRVEEIKELFEVVGVHVVRALILAIHTKEFFEPRTKNAELFNRLWQHALETATSSRKIARVERHTFRECQTAYVAGLLHDIGKFMIAAHLNSTDAPMQDGQSEEQIVGINHATAGAYLLGLWGLPEAIVTAAELHHSLDVVPPQNYNPIAYVHAAQNLASPERNHKLDWSFIAKVGKAERVPTWREVLAKQT
jgi:putative nucleotidyltransferase with HDIG domain